MDICLNVQSFYRNVKTSSCILNSHTSCCMFCAYLGSLFTITGRFFSPANVFIQVLKAVCMKPFTFESSGEVPTRGNLQSWPRATHSTDPVSSFLVLLFQIKPKHNKINKPVTIKLIINIILVKEKSINLYLTRLNLNYIWLALGSCYIAGCISQTKPCRCGALLLFTAKLAFVFWS